MPLINEGVIHQEYKFGYSQCCLRWFIDYFLHLHHLA